MGQAWKLFVALCLWTARCQAEYIADCILCDDIEAICSRENPNYEKQNETVCGDKHEFLNPDICNCGTKCIEYLEEGKPCAKTSMLFFPSELCGMGLECLTDSDGKNYCMRNPAKECVNGTLNYDAAHADGTVGPGQYRPNCDEFGQYAGRQCSTGGTCYCVNPEGKRLFGEAPITYKESMNCECAKYWEETENRGLNFGLRCLPNGNFDELQCTDMLCYCFNPKNGTISFGPFPANMMTELKCYNETFHGTTYKHPCEVERDNWDSLNQNDIVVIHENARPICNHDGHYAAVQYNGSYAYCSDLLGNQIENFKEDIFLSKHMTCNCARRRYIMEESGLGASKPKCCSNGSYYPWQIRGLLAYCVDDNGNQYGPEVAATNINGLECFVSDPCSNQ